MRVNTLSAVLVLLAVGGALAARIPYAAFEDVLASETATAGLKGTAQGLLHLTRRRDEEERGIAGVRFFVPPSEGKDFEDAWLKLEKDVHKDEKHNEIFDLKKSKLDNLIYYSYGEWEQLRDLHEHFHSDHFQDFAEYVDDHGIAWEMRLLGSMSEDIDEKQRTKEEKKEMSSKKNMAHVLIHYIVPPGETEKFTDSWLSAADKVLDEPGNRIFSLRKLATDNTRFYGYGTWDSYGDFMDHFHSKHIERLKGDLEDRDVVWFMQPLIKIGHEEE